MPHIWQPVLSQSEWILVYSGHALAGILYWYMSVLVYNLLMALNNLRRFFFKNLYLKDILDNNFIALIINII